MSFILFIIFIAVVVWLHSRISKLEELMQGRVPQQAVPQETAPSVPAVPAQQESEVYASAESAAEDEGPSSLGRLFAWAKEDWLLKLGAVLLLIAFGWLATYAFVNNWIGPQGRIAIGLVAGVLILLLGWWRAKTVLVQGSTFLVLGSSVILLTTFAARELYDFFTPTIALGIMFLSAVFVALASVYYRHRPLALASLIAAGVTPLLTNSDGADFIALFSYLLVVTLGTVWIVGITGWRILTVVALIMVSLYSLPHLARSSAEVEVLLGFVFAFTAVFFVTSILGVLKMKKEHINPDLVTAGATGLFLLTWVMMAAPDEWQSILIAAWIVVFAAGGFVTFRLTRRHEPFYIYLGVSIAMLAAATSAELNGATLVIAYAIESAIISIISYAILRKLRTAQVLSILLVGPAIMSFESVVSRAWNTGVFHKDFFVLLLMAAILVGIGIFFKQLQSQQREEHDFASFNAALIILGTVYVHVLIWLSLHATTSLTNDVATMISLVTYTLIGLGTYFYGKMNGKDVTRLYGAVLLTLVVLRLLLIDVWDMELAGRIITFFIVGILLTTTAFIGRKKHGKMAETP